MFSHSPSDRMQHVELGNLQPPACCSVCGNGTCVEGYYKIGVWIDYYGEVYLCDTCVKQLTEVAGGLIESEANFLRESSEQIAEKYATLEKDYESAVSRLSVFDSLISDAVASGVVVPEPKKDEPTEQSDSNDASGTQDTGSAEPTESGQGSGPNDTTLSELRDERTLTL